MAGVKRMDHSSLRRIYNLENSDDDNITALFISIGVGNIGY